MVIDQKAHHMWVIPPKILIAAFTMIRVHYYSLFLSLVNWSLTKSEAKHEELVGMSAGRAGSSHAHCRKIKLEYGTTVKF